MRDFIVETVPERAWEGKIEGETLRAVVLSTYVCRFEDGSLGLDSGKVYAVDAHSAGEGPFFGGPGALINAHARYVALNPEP